MPRLRSPAALFLIALIVYNANSRPISSGDTTPAALLPFSIWLDHTITFDRFHAWYKATTGKEPYYFRRLADGRSYSLYPIAFPLLITPLYAPVALALDLRQWPMQRLILLAHILEKIVASSTAALSVAALYALLRRMAGHRAALWLSLAYAFGTETWAISSQALWQHGPSELAIILSLLFLCREELPAAGLFAGLSAAFRPTDVAFLAVSAGFVLLSHRSARDKVWYGCGASAALLPAVVYNCLTYGTLMGGYGGIPLTNPLPGVLGLLFSPSRGLFVYSPIFLFAGLGVWRWLRFGQPFEPMIYGISFLFSVLHTVVVTSWSVWWGGYSFGPRMLTDISPCLVILLIPALAPVQRSMLLKPVFAAALAISIFNQGVGAFCYPNGLWDETPQTVDARPERIWNWRDTQIGRSLAAGPVLEGYRRVFRVFRSLETRSFW